MLVFLLLGQSNMAGRGALDAELSRTDGRLLMFRDAAWVPAREPMHVDPRKWAGAGLGMSFGTVVRAAFPQSTVGLVPCAVGGTPLADWMPGATLYREAIAAARAALGNEALEGVLWHQGETDAESEKDASSYLSHARLLFEALRRDLASPHACVIVGELGRFLAKSTAIRWSDTVNAALRALSSELSRSAFVSSEGLADRGDGLHFDTPSLRVLGVRYARAYLSLSDHPDGA
jgi:hypothetical protein